jgi:hypothetical protein
MVYVAQIVEKRPHRILGSKIVLTRWDFKRWSRVM